MSHASTATITLGGVPSVANGAPGGPVVQPYGAQPHPASTIVQPYGATTLTPQQQAQQNRNRRRQRQTVPEHMRQAAAAPQANTGGGSGGGTINIAPQQTHAATPRHQRSAVSGPSSIQREGDLGTVYQARGPLVSSTPDQAFQTQSLFKESVRPLEPATSAPVPIKGGLSADCARRMQLARQKLAQLNLATGIMDQYRRRFNVLDLNKDGVVNLREFAAISRVLGYKFTKDEIMEIFGRTDLDESGDISFEEFALAMYERSQKTKELAPYREKFRLYDWKGRGYITSEEAYPILKKELGFDENKTETMIDMFDRNKDYRLSLLEFIDFYKKVEELKLQVQNAFRDFDRNGDGYVDAAEAKAILIPKGFTPQQVEALIFKHDLDADGRLSFKEFASFWDVQVV